MANRRILLIDDTAKQKIADIIAYAEDHHYDPRDQSEGWLDRIPGNTPELQCMLQDGFRCVFSYTIGRLLDNPTKTVLCRQLSISVDGSDLPSVPAVLMIAELFGFTRERAGMGPIPSDWIVDIKKGDEIIDNHQCIVLAQEVKRGEA